MRQHKGQQSRWRCPHVSMQYTVIIYRGR